jgi:GAF domain-containing protein/HAMP domain-containing protein
MKSTSTGRLQNPNIELRARYAFNISRVLTVVFVLSVVLYFHLAQTTNTRQLFTVSALSAVASILNILAIGYSRQKKVETATFLMLIGIFLIIPVITLLISGVGLLLGIVGFIGIFMISTLTLAQPRLSWAIISGIVLSAATILLEVFYPSKRLEVRSISIFIPVVSFIAIAIFGYYISQQFPNYPLRNKLILLFIIIVFFSVGSVAIVTNTLIRNEITQQIGQSQQVLAERIAFETGRDLESQVEHLLATGTQFEETAEEVSTLYAGSDSEIVDQILKLDQEWVAASDQNALIESVLENEIADELREFQEIFPDHVELFLTDKYGANIAATNRTSDYYQADEDWWKFAYNLGRGRVYIGRPEFDESSQTFAVDMAIPIYANEEIAGVLRSTYAVSAILENLQQGLLGSSINFDLRISNDTLLSGESLAIDELPGLSSVMGNFGEINYRGNASLVSQQRVFSSGNSNARAAVSLLGWSIIVYEDVDNALQPVQQQTRIITLIAAVVTILVSVLGFFASQRLAAPILTLTEITGKIAEGDFSTQANISTRDEIGDLASSFNRMASQLQDTLGGLERRVQERTADLDMARLTSERRAQELQSISEISRAISTEQKNEILLPLITRLASQRFDFYHVGIFFVDETRRFAYLQAANSDGGQKMLARGHRLEIGKGLVGTVAKTGQPRIALDVGSDAVFFDNPDLPDTRSEMALPLSIRGRIIGVLDVQSTKPGAFTETDANTLGILADQVAIAIENARLFEQTQQAREEAEALNAQIQQREWNTFAKQETRVGYRQSAIGGKPLSKVVDTVEIREALKNGKIFVMDGADNNSQSVIAVPITLRGQTLGVLNIKAPTLDRKWNRDEINLAQAVSDRLALALDSARLLLESQRRAAKEAKIGEVSAKIGASINMRNILETAVEELGRALPGAEVVIQFEQDSGKSKL